MSASFPTSVKAFTTKTDGVDDVMAADINDLQNEVVAIENNLLGGWSLDGDTWVYASATSFKIVGKDVRTRFPVGTKLRLTNTTVKYFYAISATLSGSDTLVTVTGGSDYSLANAAITLPSYSYAETPQGFPQVFNYTPTWTSTGTQPSIGNGSFSGQFIMIGNLVKVRMYLSIGSTTNKGTGIWQFGLPFAVASNQMIGNALPYQAGVGYKPAFLKQSSSTECFTLDCVSGAQAEATSPFTWAAGNFMAANIDVNI